MSVAVAPKGSEPSWRRFLRHAETVAMLTSGAWVVLLFLTR
jgi:hypothetical protein